MKNFLFKLKLIYWAFNREDKLNAFLLYRDAKNTYQRKRKNHQKAQKEYREYCLKRAIYDSVCQGG
jgi:hypothetical protein